MTSPPAGSDPDRVLFHSPTAVVGRFVCPIDRPDFADTGPIRSYLAVFPSTAVAIQHDGQDPVLADPSVAMLYNRDQVYRRAPVHPAGDRCDWFALGEAPLREIIGAIDPGAAESERPIRFSHAPCPARLYLLQRVLVRALNRAHPDPMEVEETALLIVETAIRAAYGARGAAPGNGARGETTRAHRAAVDDVRAAMLARIDGVFTLDDAAGVAHLSPYHLSRVFRRVTGQTLSQYRTDLRLRVALERVTEGDADLTSAALDAGFSSHSHLTNRFRERFGVAPSAIRRDDLPALLREIRKSVQAEGRGPRRSSGRRGRRSAA